MFKKKTNLQVPSVHGMATSVVNKVKFKCDMKQGKMSESLGKSNENLNEPKDNFVFPNKRKLIASPVSQPKRYVLDSSQLCKDNKYQILSEHSYASPVIMKTILKIWMILSPTTKGTILS